MNELTGYEAQQVLAIRRWQREEPGVVAKATGRLAGPLAWVARSLVPEASIRAALDASNATAVYLAGAGDLLRAARVRSIDDLGRLDLETQDRLAASVHGWAIGYASTEGAISGAAGLLGIVADLPVVVTLSLRTIHKIGACYGYAAGTTRDNRFAYGVLAASGANSVAEKVSALLVLRSLEVLLTEQTFRAMSEKAVQSALSREAAITSLRSLARSLGINLTRRRALAAIPVVGAAIGGTANGWWLKEVGWAARHAFQRRRLVDAGKLAAGDDLA